jgi:hypothetical protein
MEAEGPALVQQALAAIVALDDLSIYACGEADGVVPRALGRLSAAERQIVAASLTLLLDGLHRPGQRTDGEPA